jgi:hypothetical protein
MNKGSLPTSESSNNFAKNYPISNFPNIPASNQDDFNKERFAEVFFAFRTISSMVFLGSH